MGLVSAVLCGFAVALIAPWIYRLARGATGWLLALFPLALLLYFLSYVGTIAAGETARVSFSWVPLLGINLSFYVDGLSLLFASLISGIGALVLIYAGGYLKGHPHLGRFYGFILMFMASMLGVVLADNTLTLFMFWELTSVSSFLLIGFEHDKEGSRAAALQALLVTGLGGLALLAGFLLMSQVAGSRELSELLLRGDVLRADPLYVPIVILILGGAFTKSAQFPFHFWLPGAMQAPTPVSAYLHSATMVKAGIYLMARVTPALGETVFWSSTIVAFGATTMVIAAFIGYRQTDLKLILAYSTISALGIMTLLLGLGTPKAIDAMIVFLMGHAFYKGALFMLAGLIDHETGTRDINRLGGLLRDMPISAAAGFLAALSMAGVMAFFGFYGKELLYESLHDPAQPVLLAASVLTGMIFVSLAILAGIKPFIGEKKSTPKHAHEAPVDLWLGPVALVIIGMVLGVVPTIVDQAILLPAIRAVLQRPVTFGLVLWHGFTPIFILSLITLAGGVVLFVLRDRLLGLFRMLEPLGRWGPAYGYTLGLAALNGTARAQTRLLQSGYLRYYVLIVVLTTMALVASKLPENFAAIGAVAAGEAAFYEWGLALLILMAALFTTQTRSRLSAIAAMGVIGYSVALIFVLFSAPDLAMTQIMVESLTVILFVLVFYHLPGFGNLSSRGTRARDGAVALSVGALMTAVVIAAVAANELHPKISGYFTEHSVALAHGRNIVNVILVDFRGLDTLGEITVLAIAAIGVYALLKLRPAKENGK